MRKLVLFLSIFVSTLFFSQKYQTIENVISENCESIKTQSKKIKIYTCDIRLPQDNVLDNLPMNVLINYFEIDRTNTNEIVWTIQCAYFDETVIYTKTFKRSKKYLLTETKIQSKSHIDFFNSREKIKY